jgi:hypothetical protein
VSLGEGEHVKVDAGVEVCLAVGAPALGLTEGAGCGDPAGDPTHGGPVGE